MKKLLLAPLCLLLSLALSAQVIRDMDITVDVKADGSATITTDWDVDVTQGTEWYVPVGNLGKMEVTSLTVYENGKAFIDEGFGWNTKRSMPEKMFRSGMVKKKDGVELCWGQGNPGPHQWRSVVKVTGLVQSLQDYDAFNFMFVNPEMGSGPRHAKVTIRNLSGGAGWTPENTKVWAFGFPGEIHVTEGGIVAETTEAMSRSDYLVVMARLDKGLLSPAITRNMRFAKMQKKAFKGSDYSSGKSSGWESFWNFLMELPMEVIFLVLALLGAGILSLYTALFGKYKKDLIGVTKVKGWYRDAPLAGSLPASFYVLQNCRRFSLLGEANERDLFGAYFLKWILEKKMTPVPEEGNPEATSLVLQPDASFDDALEASLYQMVLEASGENRILESSEFKAWSKENYEEVEEWPKDVSRQGKAILQGQGLLNDKNQGTAQGLAAMRHVLEFKSFLKEFTLSDQRTLGEVPLWKDYLLFAELFGMADAVSAQLQKLYPAEFASYAQSLDLDMVRLIDSAQLCRSFSSTMYYTASQTGSSSRSSGSGGFSSRGGGGGFSGGGRGGGSR